MSSDYLDSYLPKDENDVKCMLRLYDLNDDEVIAITGGLIECGRKHYGQVTAAISVFLISRQDLIIEEIKEILESEQSDYRSKIWAVTQLVPYFSMNNQEKLMPSLIRMGLSSEEKADVAIDIIIEYRKKKDLCSFGSYRDDEKVRNLFALSDADARAVVRRILYDFVEIYERIRIPAVMYMIEKQDMIADDVKQAYDINDPGNNYDETLNDGTDRKHRFLERRLRKEGMEGSLFPGSFRIYNAPFMINNGVNIDFDLNYSVQYYRQFLYDNLICFFTKENQERILGGISPGNNLLQT